MNKIQWNVLKLMVMSLTVGFSAANLTRHYDLGLAAILLSLLLVTISGFHRNFIRPFNEKPMVEKQNQAD